MKRVGRWLSLFFCLCFLLPFFCLAEEEDFPLDEIEDSIPDLGDFFEDDFFEEEDVSLALQNLFNDELNRLTLDNEPINDIDLLGDSWWKVAPVLVTESQTKEGVVKLTWVQPGTSNNTLDSNIKYYIYAFDSINGDEYPVGKAKSGAKKEVSITKDGVTYTGLGNSTILRDQWAGTEYYVRAEKHEKKFVPEYGISSNTAAFTGTDARWKMLDDFTFYLQNSRILLSWFSPNVLSTDAGGEVISGFEVDMTYYIDEDVHTINLEIGRTGVFHSGPVECQLSVEEAYLEGADYAMILPVPEEATQVSVRITPIKNGNRGKTSSTTMLTL